MMLRLTFEIHCTVHVTTELLFPVIPSMLVVMISAALLKVDHATRKLVNVPVSVIVPQLPAGSVQRGNTVVDNETCPFMVSLITTLSAGCPPLFPYLIV